MEPTDNRSAILRMNRVIWFAMLLGQLMFLAVVLFLCQQSPAPRGDPSVARLLFYVSAALLVFGVSVGFVIRGRIFRAARDSGGLAGAYLSGNIILWATCEGASFMALVNVMLSHVLMPSLAVAVVAMLVQAATFPTRAAMES